MRKQSYALRLALAVALVLVISRATRADSFAITTADRSGLGFGQNEKIRLRVVHLLSSAILDNGRTIALTKEDNQVLVLFDQEQQVGANGQKITFTFQIPALDPQL